MARSHPPRRVAPLLAIAVALVGLAGLLMGAALGADGVDGAATSDPGAGTGGREVVGELGHLADVVSAVPPSSDALRGSLRGPELVLAGLGAALATLLVSGLSAAAAVPAAVPSAVSAHVRRRGPPSVFG
jgi:hypothetical protein